MQTLRLAAAMLAALLSVVGGAAASGPTFLPDATVKGSSLTGWRPIGAAALRAQDGEIAGAAGSDGWLATVRGYQDVGFYAEVLCPAGCKAGVLLRAQPTPDGGRKGVFLSLTQGDVAAYRVVLDPQGRIVQRERLPNADANGAMLRMAPVPPPRPPPPPGAPRPAGPPRAPGPRGVTLPMSQPSGELNPDGWNRIEVFLDANVIRWFVNDGSVIFNIAIADKETDAYGPIALYSGGTGARFKSVAYKDLSLKTAPREQVSSRFRMQRLSEFFYSWSATAADFNRDGVLDVATGPYIYYGPDYTRSREVYVAHPFHPADEFPGAPYRQHPDLYPDNAWVVHAADFTGDGWPDILTADHAAGGVATLYINPRGEARRWDKVTVLKAIETEISLLGDIDGDGKPELVYGAEGFVRYAKPDPANPTGSWQVHSISESGPWGHGHGVGVGDIDGDGRMDIVTAWGWWRQPTAGAASGRWEYHPEAFGRWDRSEPGGGAIAVYDVNGDGKADIVTGLQAHGFGLAWFEQRRVGGQISFLRHMIMDGPTDRNAGGVWFTELHGSTSADVDGDGVPDFIVGKRHWSHHDSYYDPDAYGPAVLYWYRTVRDPKAPGGARFEPHLIHNRSGVGSDVLAMDLNKDGAMDVVTSTTRGTSIFWGAKTKR